MQSTLQGYIGLGSNLGERAANLQRALDLMAATSRLDIIRVSSVYEAPPWGYDSDNAYLNAIVEVTWDGPPLRLLEQCYRIEASMGRHRNGPRDYTGYRDRIIDLDIIWLDGMESSDERLVLPHKHAHQRGFVLAPLNELDPGLLIRGKAVKQWLVQLDATELARVTRQDAHKLNIRE